VVRSGEARRSVVGWGAVAHTWSDRPERELLSRRDELYAHGQERSLYVSSLERTDGTRASLVLEHHRNSELTAGGTVFGFRGGPLGTGDAAYPMPTTWEIDEGPDVRVEARLDRELLRMNPLDILPQPFRFLLGLGGKPLRVWADATVKRDFVGTGGQKPTSMALSGIAVSTFARPAR
jgi:hypothetical protein